MKLPGHPVKTGQARWGVWGTKWQAESEQTKFHIVPLAPAYTAGLAGHAPVKKIAVYRWVFLPSQERRR